jgi:hypothetical protein
MGFIERRNGRYRARYRDPLGRQLSETGVLARDFGAAFIFKGGTSLSKGYRIVERFSEDIDVLVLPTGRGRGATDKMMKDIGEASAEGIGGTATARLTIGRGGAFACEQRDRLGLLREKAGGIEKRRKVSAAASLDVGERRDLAR